MLGFGSIGYDIRSRLRWYLMRREKQQRQQKP